MVSAEVQRTLVKSPPELWAELSDPVALSRHLGELGEIRITRVEPEHKVEWAAESARGTVLMKASGWGTRVTLTATADAAEGRSTQGADAADHAPEPPSDVSDAPADRAGIPLGRTEAGGEGDRARGDQEPAIPAERMAPASLANDEPPSASAAPLSAAEPGATSAHAERPPTQEPLAKQETSAGATAPRSPLAVEQHMPLPTLWELEREEKSDRAKPLDGLEQRRSFLVRIVGRLRRRETTQSAGEVSSKGSAVTDDRPAAHESPVAEQAPTDPQPAARPEPQSTSPAPPSAGVDPQPPAPEQEQHQIRRLAAPSPGPDPQPQEPGPPNPGRDPRPPAPRPESPAPKPIDIIRAHAGEPQHVVSQESAAPLAQEGGGEDVAPDSQRDAAPDADAIEEMTALLTSVLDRLGAAHHRPFSRA